MLIKSCASVLTSKGINNLGSMLLIHVWSCSHGQMVDTVMSRESALRIMTKTAIEKFLQWIIKEGRVHVTSSLLTNLVKQIIIHVINIDTDWGGRGRERERERETKSGERSNTKLACPLLRAWMYAGGLSFLTISMKRCLQGLLPVAMVRSVHPACHMSRAKLQHFSR